jgi:CBS-domain-containing membrane protein
LLDLDRDDLGRHLVAVLHDDSGRLAGVLTGPELLTALDDGVEHLTAQNVMTAPALTITADASLSQAADLMLAREVHQLFVVDYADQGPPRGLVSTADVIVEMASAGSVWRALRPAVDTKGRKYESRQRVSAVLNSPPQPALNFA